MKNRSEVNEEILYKRLLPTLRQRRDVVIGPGDDCAAVSVGDKKKLFLLAVDQVIEGIHYDEKKTSPAVVGAKLLKRNLSDIAAMGGTPAHALVAMASAKKDFTWYRSFVGGLEKEARKWGVSICGGDIAQLPSKKVNVASLTITGYVEKKKMCLRSNVKVGDLLYVTGKIGSSYETGHHLSFVPRLQEGLFLAGRFSNAMIDISDGLLKDLGRMTQASGVCVCLDTRLVPLRKKTDMVVKAISDGEDYELLIAVPASKASRLEKDWPFKKTRLTRIGEFFEGEIGLVFDENGVDLGAGQGGFDHFDRT
jgi:thiamine-monophosphate kinase